MNKVCYFFYIALTMVAGSCLQNRGDSKSLFRLLPSGQTGITFNNQLEETHQLNVLEYQDFYSGGGVAIGDFDHDGLPDIFFTGNQVPARLYKNLGDLKFRDITTEAGLSRMGRGWYTGAAMADINSDGYLDIYVCKSGMEAPEDRANLLFINTGNGAFVEQAEKYGLAHQGFAVNASFFDYDRDGDLDIYLVNQGPVKITSGNARALRNQSHPEAGDVLFENVGGRFVDVTAQSGIYSSVIGFAHGVAIGDVNDDGWEDIFVSNDFFEYDYLYINNGDKTFTETIKESTKHISYYSMGNDMADFNNDGLLDIVVLDMIAEGNRRLYSNLGGMNLVKFRSHLENGLHYQYMSNVLHLNNGNGTFSEIGNLAGIARTDWSWAALFADFDNDGWKDLYVTNGIRKDVRSIDFGKFYFDMLGMTGGEHNFSPSQWELLLGRMPSEPVENYMFRNTGDLRFEQVMESWGLNQKSWSNGVAVADLDLDGDLDLVVNNIDQEAFVYENTLDNRHFIRFTFSGPPDNPFGIGTKVIIYHSEGLQYQQHYLVRGYRSSMEPVMHFGLAQDSVISRIEVTWFDGKKTVYENIASGQVFHLDYNEAKATDVVTRKSISSFFSDSEITINIRHEENDMEDFIRNPTMPFKMSALGPAFALADVNGDGKDDFFLGGAFRRPGALMIQGENDFRQHKNPVFEEDRMYEDVGAVFFDVDNDNDVDLYVVSGGNENSPENGFLNDRLYLNDGFGNFVKAGIPEVNVSGSVVRAFDYDQDGFTDLFVAGRQVPGQYPMPADSYLLKNNQGKLIDVTNEIAPQLRQLGLVTDAMWADYDGDGDMDIMVVGEWMPVTIFENRGGEFLKVENKANGLENSYGWWWSIAGDDFDGDGDIDFVAGNMGLNYKHHPSNDYPLLGFAGDLTGKGEVDFAMGYYQNGTLYPVYDWNYVEAQNPKIRERIKSVHQFSVSDLYEIYGKTALDSAAKFKINTLESSIIENLGDGRFRIRPFPTIAQISSINSIILEDVDLDGHTDLILAGNLYPFDVRTIRNDAGIGLWMRGDGKGNFSPVHHTRSSLYLPGDVRHVQKIMINNALHLIAAKNDDFIQMIKMNSSRSR